MARPNRTGKRDNHKGDIFWREKIIEFLISRAAVGATQYEITLITKRDVDAKTRSAFLQQLYEAGKIQKFITPPLVGDIRHQTTIWRATTKIIEP